MKKREKRQIPGEVNSLIAEFKFQANFCLSRVMIGRELFEWSFYLWREKSTLHESFSSGEVRESDDDEEKDEIPCKRHESEEEKCCCPTRHDKMKDLLDELQESEDGQDGQVFN